MAKTIITISIDNETLHQFNEVCPPGHRSRTVEEFMQEYIKKNKPSDNIDQSFLVQKELEAQRTMSELEAIRARLREKEAKEKEREGVERAERERINSFTERNERMKLQARAETLIELGLPMNSTVIPPDVHSLFMDKWKKRHQELMGDFVEE